MLTDARKTALIAGIAITSSLLWSFIAQILTAANYSSVDLIATTALFLFILMLELTRPVFLFVLYRTDITLSLSRTMHFLVQVLIAVLGLSFLIFFRDKWSLSIFSAGGRLASSANRGGWFLVLPGSELVAVIHLISNILDSLSRLLSIVFLVVLMRQTAPQTMPLRAAKTRVKKAAAIAITARALFMAVGICSYIAYAYAVQTYSAAGARPYARSLLSTLLFQMPALLMPWIVYRSVRNRQPADSF